MAGGTEAFPDLGRHCQNSDCRQLDFLPFTCDGCHKVFCAEHRSSKSHACPNSDHNSRKVIVCVICSTSIETTGKAEANEIKLLERHRHAGDCNPAKKKKPTCAARRCRQILTFSNTCVCKTCRLKLCLRHRFPTEHACGGATVAAVETVGEGRWSDKFLAALGLRNGVECGKSGERRGKSPASVPSVEAC